MKTFVYLACPYSHPEGLVRAERAQIAARAAEFLMGMCSVYCPIVHGHAIECETGTKHGALFWIEQDAPFIHACYALVVLGLDGWKESEGVKWEMEVARERGIPIMFMATAESIPIPLQ
jgi:hypothetical protein